MRQSWLGLPPAWRPAWRVRFAMSCTLALVLAGAAPPAARAEGPEALPTQEEIHQSFDEQKYPQTLQKLTRVLALKGPVAQGYDRHDLLRLKAETQLRLKSNPAAMQTLAEAAKTAPDANAASVDLATQLLIRRSQAGQYTPQTRGPGKAADPIPILDLSRRKAALVALYRDEFAEHTARIKAASGARTLLGFMEVMPEISSLHALEVAATDGKADETKKLIAEPAKTAQELMSGAVDDMKVQVEALDKSANRIVSSFEVQRGPGPGGFVRVERWHRQGLNAREQANLRDIEGSCERIYLASQELAVILGPDGSLLDAVRTSAEKAGRKADQVLKADYSRAYNNPNGS